MLPKHLWQDLLGTRFEAKGRTKSGLDCHGLAKILMARFGYDLPDPADGWDLCHNSDSDPFIEGINEFGADKIELKDVEELDIILIQIRAAKWDHIAVCLDNGHALHCDRQRGVVVDSISQLTKDRRVAAYRFHQRPQVQQVTVVTMEDALVEREREVCRFEYIPGGQVTDYVPYAWKKAGLLGQTYAALNDKQVKLNEEVPPGSYLALVKTPAGDVGIPLLLSGALSLLSYALNIALVDDQKPKEDLSLDSPTFDPSGLRNTAATGTPAAVVYGRHVVGGNQIGAYLDVDDDNRQVLNLLLCVGLGPIEDIGGINYDADEVRGSEIPDEIKLNGVPAARFDNVEISIRLGKENQRTVPGFDRTTVGIPVDITLERNLPQLRTTENVITGFSLILNYPRGLYKTRSNGSTAPRKVEYRIRYRPVGSTTWTTRLFDNETERNYAFNTKHTIEGLAEDLYDIELTRTSPDYPQADPNKVDQSDWVSYNEFLPGEQAYPGCALIGIRALSDRQLQGGGFPTHTSIIRGRKVWIWDDARGRWEDEERWTDIPAWCVLDMLLNEFYGGGLLRGISFDNIPIEEWTAWKNYTEESVSDGRGGMTRRATFNMVYDETIDLWEAAVAAANAAFAKLLPEGNMVHVDIQQAKAPVALINVANCAGFTAKFFGESTRDNVFEADFWNEETDFEQDLAQLPAERVIVEADRISKKSMQIPGVTRPSQAYRLLTRHENLSFYQLEQISFESGVEALHLRPGDVFIGQHEVMSEIEIGGKILSATTNTLTIDRDVTLEALVFYNFIIQTRVSGQLEIVQVTVFPATEVTYTKGTPIPLDVGFSGTIPVLRDPYIGGPISQLQSYYQVESIELDPETITRTITASLYNEEIFNDDPAFVPESTEDILRGDKFPEEAQQATNLRFGIPITEIQRLTGKYILSLQAVWDAGDVVSTWHVHYRTYAYDEDTNEALHGDWVEYGATTDNKLWLENIPFGLTVQIAVTPGAKCGGALLPDQVQARNFTAVNYRTRSPVLTDIPEAEDTVRMSPVDDHIQMRFQPFPGLGGYQIRKGLTWASGSLIGNYEAGYHQIHFYSDRQTTLQAALVSEDGIFEKITSFTIEQFLPKDRSIRADDIFEPTFSGTYDKTEVVNEKLQITSGNLDGTYTSDEVSQGNNLNFRVGLVDAETELEAKPLKLRQCGFRLQHPIYGQLKLSEWVTLGYENQDAIRVRQWKVPLSSDLMYQVRCRTGPINLIDELQTVVKNQTRVASGSTWLPAEIYIPREQEQRATRAIIELKRPFTPSEMYNPQLTRLKVALWE